MPGAWCFSATAAESFARAVALDPGHSDAWLSRGNALLGVERLEEALACFDRAAEVDARDWRAWMDKGVVEQARAIITELASGKRGPAGAEAAGPLIELPPEGLGQPVQRQRRAD